MLFSQLYLTKQPGSSMVPFNGGFYTHPDFPPNNTSGFVTISGEETPTLRWVFLDANTHEVRWGGRPDSEGHVCGPFDWTKDEQYVTLEGWEGWLAVRLPEDESRDLADDEIVLEDRWHAGIYGIPDEGTLEAMRTAARLEGMITDPVYEGKSMAALIDLVRTGEIPRDATVLYAHLGGQPALPAYASLFT